MLSIQNLRHRPRLIALLFACATAAAAVWLAHNWSEQQQAYWQERSTPKGGSVEVLVFAKALDLGTVLREQTLAVRQVQKNLLPEGAFTPEQFAQVSGRRLSASVRKGELLLPQNLAAIQHQDSVAMARPGFRLIAVDRSSGQMTWSAMTPRDRIDVWAIGVNPDEIQPPRNEQGGFQREMATSPLTTARPIATGIRVLSSGDSSSEGASAPGQLVAKAVTYFLEMPEPAVSAYLSAASSSQVRYVLNVNGIANASKPLAKPKPIEILMHEEGVNG